MFLAAVCLGFAAGASLGEGVMLAAAGDCGPCPGSIRQECTTGPCSGKSARVGAFCMISCCYGDNQEKCGAKEIMAQDPPEPLPPTP